MVSSADRLFMESSPSEDDSTQQQHPSSSYSSSVVDHAIVLLCRYTVLLCPPFSTALFFFFFFFTATTTRSRAARGSSRAGGFFFFSFAAFVQCVNLQQRRAFRCISASAIGVIVASCDPCGMDGSIADARPAHRCRHLVRLRGVYSSGCAGRGHRSRSSALSGRGGRAHACCLAHFSNRRPSACAPWSRAGERRAFLICLVVDALLHVDGPRSTATLAEQSVE